MSNRIFQFILELTKFLSVFISTLLFLTIIIPRTLFFLFPDSPSLNKQVLEMSDLRYSILYIFMLLSIGWLVSYKQKALSIINPFKTSKEEIVTLLIISGLFSYYFSKSFIVFGPLNSFSLIIFTLFFLFFFTQIISFYKSYTYQNLFALKGYFVQSLRPENLFSFSKNLLLLSFIVLLAGYSLFITSYTLKRNQDYQKILQQSLFITKISPSRTTYAYRVTLEGYNFGQIPDRKNQLLSTYGPVITSSWTNNKIEFVIPLHWKEGNVDLWIEKPYKYGEKKTIASNSVQLELLNRWDFFPTKYDNIQVRAIKRLIRILYLDYWNNISTELPLPF